jgi:carbamoyl-phosphate synthase large subunit
MRILTEASGSLVSAYLIRAIQESGHQAVGSDIDICNAGFCLADDFLVVPRHDDPRLWPVMARKISDANIDIVIPSFDETLLGWAQRRGDFQQNGIFVCISPPETIQIFQDKWETFEFFSSIGIPTPNTSLEQRYSLIKPRHGRGSEGIRITDEYVPMEGMISQEVVEGIEYTVDAFFDRDGHPIYIIPRKRLAVQQGKSTRGIVCRHDRIERYVRKIAAAIEFTGPINFQCFVHDDEVEFIEINPRVAGGMALGFAASENWVSLIVNNLIHGLPIQPKSVQNGLKMVRYYAERFIS